MSLWSTINKLSDDSLIGYYLEYEMVINNTIIEKLINYIHIENEWEKNDETLI